MRNFAPLVGLLMVLTSFSLFAQVETRTESSDEQRNDDSLTVVLPEKGIASLSMITPPEGFEPTDKFNGYLHLEASSGIIMTMVENANYIKISEGMTDEFYAKNNLVFIEKQDFVSENAVKGTFFKCSFVTSDVEFTRYMVYAGDLNNTLWLNITYPTKLTELIEDGILKTIQSIKLKDASDEK